MTGCLYTIILSGKVKRAFRVHLRATGLVQKKGEEASRLLVSLISPWTSISQTPFNFSFYSHTPWFWSRGVQYLLTRMWSFQSAFWSWEGHYIIMSAKMKAHNTKICFSLQMITLICFMRYSCTIWRCHKFCSYKAYNISFCRHNISRWPNTESPPWQCLKTAMNNFAESELVTELLWYLKTSLERLPLLMVCRILEA